MNHPVLGTLTAVPALDRPDLLAEPVAVALAGLDAGRVGVKRRLDVRKASFAPMDDAVALTGMAYGGITPIGLPADWPLWLSPGGAEADAVVVGSGTRAGKLAVPGDLLASLPGAQVVPDLAR